MDYESNKLTLLPKLFEALYKNTEVKISPQGAIKINSEKLDHKMFSDWFLTLCKNATYSDFYALVMTAPSPLVFFEDFRRALVVYSGKMKYSDLKGIDVIKDFSYDNFIPFISVDDANKKMFYNMQSREICDLDYKTYELTVEKQYRRNPIRAVIDFNPYRPENIYKALKYGQECTHINTYQKPEWQYNRELTPEEKMNICILPEIISDFMKHLFPDKQCREYVYDWLHWAITKRCETYLVLNGAKGIGKGIFTDHLCKALMGKNNHKLAPQSALDSNFNAMLENCRMIVFDEFRIDEEDKINKLKRYINTDQAIEHKGVDVGKTVETYNSMIVSSNSTSDIKIYWDDRRFSVADISDKKLNEVWSKEKIKTLIDALGEEESPIMRQFGYWLLYRKPKGDIFTLYTGVHFYKLCYSSLPEWSRLVIDEVTSGHHEIVDDMTLKMLYKDRNPQSRFPNPHKVEDFLKNYKHEGMHYLGDLRKEGAGWHINVGLQFFKPKLADAMGGDWNIL